MHVGRPLAACGTAVRRPSPFGVFCRVLGDEPVMLADARTFYDQTPVQRSTAADLDHEAAEEKLAAIRERSQGLDIAGMPRERLLANWGLLAESSGCPTVAGALLLGMAPQRFLPHAYVSALSSS